MVEKGLDKGVLELDDLIENLTRIRRKFGNKKISVNNMLVYYFSEVIYIDEENDCIDFCDVEDR